MADNKNVISSALDLMRFVEILSEDFEARSYSQIVKIVKAKGLETSQTKIHNILTTLESAGWAARDSNDLWRLTPRFASLAVNYHHYIIRRSNQLLNEVAEVHGKERIKNAD